jgi:GAF domain-containing protein
MPDEQPLDPDLAARLRAASDARVRQQIQAAARRRDDQQQTRAQFLSNRQRGIRSRHSAKAARLGLTQLHDKTEENEK